MADNTPSSLTILERLQLSNQFAILEKLDPTEQKHYAMCREVMERGYTSFYGEVFQGIGDELPEDYGHFVFDVLDMHRDLKGSYDSLADKSGIDPFLVTFRGFDGNNEHELYAFLKFLKEHGRFSQTLEECGLDSHCPTVERYRGMLGIWKPIREKYQSGFSAEWQNLTSDEIKQVIDWKKTAAA
jgi:uncharacterized protein YfbU (UPF0304 family)